MTNAGPSISLGMDFFKSMNAGDKGFFGEKIASFYLRDQLVKNPERMFPEFAEIDSEHIYRPTPRKAQYTVFQSDGDVLELSGRKDGCVDQFLLEKSGERSHVGTIEDWPEETQPWSADIVLSISNLYGADDIERTALCEVKTGEYAEFHGQQLEVMEVLNRVKTRYILRANVVFNAEQETVDLRFDQLTSTDLDNETRWEPWKP